MRKHFRVPAVLLAATMLAACGSDDGGGGGGGGEDGGLSLDQVRLAIDGDDFMNQLAWQVADERYWPDLGFTEAAEVFATDEYIAGLAGGDVWVAQGESDVIWSAMAEGSIPLTVIGVEKDAEAFFLGIREGVDPSNLEGLKVSGGAAGDRNITVAEQMLDGLGVDPESMEWVQVEGGSDERLQALLAGQIDVAALQPRHVLPLTEAGGQMIVEEYQRVPQEVWVTTEDVMKNNRDAVCAYLEGRIAAKQWISEGADFMDNQEAAVAIAEARGESPSEGDLDEWQIEMEQNWSLTGGSPLETFEKWNDDMIDSGNVPEGFDWKEHADFSCLTEAQENLGLEVEPGNLD
jgi:ABC-type nitrate/sulfonate/bicarbonate transport system substrate-binding protein